jgi:mRNA-degrading endonuclease RelE of RelBE toxin-antitoxin system
VTSHTTAEFRKAFDRLPKSIQKQARAAYRLFQSNPQHPSLRFKRVHDKQLIYSARINRSYRAVGVLDGEEIVWFWIGAHKEYERIIAKSGTG